MYKIKADSVKITNDSCNAELILENATRNVQGFLYNKGNGRTEFRKGAIRLNDSTYIIGADTVKTGGGAAKFNAKDGLVRNSDDVFLGSTTSGSGPHNFTANRHLYLNGKYFSIGGTARNPDSFPVFRFYDNGNFTAGISNDFVHPVPYTKTGLRYNARLGYLQIGLSTIVDTTIANPAGSVETAAIILNTDSRGNIQGRLQNAFIGAYNVNLPAGQTIASSILTGGSFFLGAGMAHTIAGGVFHTVNGGTNATLIMGNSNQILQGDRMSGWFGAVNTNYAYTTACLVAGVRNGFAEASLK